MTGAWFVLRRLARDLSALLGLVLIAVLVASAVLAPVLATHPDDVFELHPAQRLKAPDRTHWLGTDRMGSDVYSRLLFGARITILIVALVLAAILAPVLATHPDDVFELHPAKRLRAPGGEHWLGTDRMGSDIYSRLLFGARITILIGVIAVGAALLVGVPVGLVAGYHHGWVSDGLMRVSDIFLAVPQVVLAIAIAQTLGPSLPNVILALSATYWPWFARVVYAEKRTLQKEVFVESTTALGASPWRLVALHVLPNIASPIIVRASIGMGFTVWAGGIFIVVNLLVDVAHTLIDPRERTT